MSNILYEYQDNNGFTIYPVSILNLVKKDKKTNAYTFTSPINLKTYKLVKVIKTGATIEGYDGIKITYILEGVK